MAEVRVWNRSEQVTQGGILLLLGGFSSRLLLYVANIVLARSITPAELGLFFLSVTVLQGLALIGLLGLEATFLRFAPRFEVEGRRARLDAALQGSLAWTLGMSAICSFGLYAGAGWIAVRLHQPGLDGPLRAVALTLPLMVLLRLVSVVFQATLRVPSTLLLRNLAYPVLFVVVLPLVMRAWPTAVGGLIAQGIALAMPVVLGGVWLRRRLELLGPVRETRWEASLELLVFSVPLLLGGVVGFVALWSDSLLTGYFLPADAVARYGVAFRISLTATILLEAFNGALGPAASRLADGGGAGMEPMYRDVTRLGLMLYLPLFGAMLVFPEALLGLFGSTYVSDETTLALRILAIGQLVNVAVGGAGMLLIIAGRTWLNLANGLAMVVVNVGLCALWIPRLGIVGAAMAAATSVALVNLARAVQLKALLGVMPVDRRWTRPVAAFGGASAVGLAARRLLETPAVGGAAGSLPLAQSWAGVGVLVCCFAGLVLALRLEPAEKALLHRLLGRGPSAS